MADSAELTAERESSTASAAEIERFRRIAEAWWDPDGDFRPLHQLNPVRASYVIDRLAHHFGRDPEQPYPLSGLRIADVGCGGGLMSEAIARQAAIVTGIDAEAEAIRIARLHAESQGLTIAYRCTVPEQVAAEGAIFDVVLSMEVVEHVADLRAFVAATVRLLAPGGAMVFATLNRTMKSLALAKIGAEYLLRWLPVGTHQWHQFVKPSEFAAHLRREGMTVTDLTGFAYDPLKGTWRLSGDLAVNYAAFAVRD